MQIPAQNLTMKRLRGYEIKVFIISPITYYEIVLVAGSTISWG